MYNVPVLFLIFKRPNTTKQVFDSIRKVKPKKLFIAADGPRNEKEQELCEKTREIVLNNIDWDCEIETLFREENLGLKIAVSSAIDWFFEHVEEGIILEDDTVPNLSFFNFSELMLNKYRDNHQIMSISGETELWERQTSDSYYFSNIPLIWGWATWKRAWQKFDLEMSEYEKLKKQKFLKHIFPNYYHQKDWINLLDMTYNNQLDSWGFRWFYSVFENKGMCIIPNTNLVSNIGFGSDATHTLDEDSPCSNKKCFEINLDLKHPKIIEVDIHRQKRVLVERFEMPARFSLKRYEFFKQNKVIREFKRALYKTGFKYVKF